MRLGLREVYFGTYLVVNLAIIVFSIWLWSRGLSSEAIFVGLWAPTLNLLYVMYIVTFQLGRIRADVTAIAVERAGGRRIA